MDKKIWIIVGLLLVAVISSYGTAQVVSQFTADEKVVLDRMVEKELLKKNPTDITKEDLDMIKSHYGIDKVTINFTSVLAGNKTTNCQGGKCAWMVCTNYRDCFLFQRAYEGETELSILVSAEKRIIDNEIRRLTAKDEAFLWWGFKDKEITAKVLE